MKILRVNNVNTALPRMLRMIRNGAKVRESRAGKCYEFPTPVTTIYNRPWERVLFSPERDANPFFHLMEALWMLAGRNDIEFLTFYNRWMENIAEADGTQHGAYGYRWRVHFGRDQLDNLVDLLSNKPLSRRGVVMMYDPKVDTDVSETLKDVPCNIAITFQINERSSSPYLDMTVFCRSNDAIWGAAGANAVHFPILQEYIAAKLRVEIGVYYQVSVNLHTYEDTYKPLIDAGLLQHAAIDPYQMGAIKATPIVTDTGTFDTELECFLEDDWPPNNTDWQNDFFPEVACPMALAYNHFRQGVGNQKYVHMFEALKEGDYSSDWIQAAKEWTARRQANYIKKHVEKSND